MSKRTRTSLTSAVPDVDSLILELRGQKVLLDRNLAWIYGVPTKALNQAVKRNPDRFPDDFLFRLTRQESTELNRSQIVTGSQKHRDPRFMPYAFTEHGAVMAANVLKSPRAIQMSVFVVRAFVKMRAALLDTRDLARKLAALETELKSRLDTHEVAIVDILQRFMKMFEPVPASPEPPKPEDRISHQGRFHPVSGEKKTRQAMNRDSVAKTL
jgi:hypothetical protein